MTPERKREIEVAAALLLLQRRAQRGLRVALRAIALPLLTRAPATRGDAIVSTVTTKSIITVRATARASARGLSVLPSSVARAVSERGASQDVDRAIRAGVSMGRQWGPVLEEAEGDVRAGVAALGSRLDRTAITEVMEAWNAESAILSARAAAAGLVVIDTWHAMLDACEKCWELDGQTRRRPRTFAETPPVHPRCACWIDTSYAESRAA